MIWQRVAHGLVKLPDFAELSRVVSSCWAEAHWRILLLRLLLVQHVPILRSVVVEPPLPAVLLSRLDDRHGEDEKTRCEHILGGSPPLAAAKGGVKCSVIGD